ncbi:pyrophosphate-energized vacuolar membrane proton pump [Tanacetum coccineum]
MPAVFNLFGNSTIYFSPVQDVADSSRTGAAKNNAVTGLTTDAYGPISDNAGGIAEMAGMSHCIPERTDALDVARNTIATIRKGFAIGSAAIVSLALLSAFVSRAEITTVDVLTICMWLIYVAEQMILGPSLFEQNPAFASTTLSRPLGCSFPQAHENNRRAYVCRLGPCWA